MSLRVCLFDHLRVPADVEVPPRVIRPRAQRLLAYLLLHRQRPLTREQIAFALWPDVPENRALGTLRRALSELRAALTAAETGEWLVVTDTSLHWNADSPYWLDIDVFEQSITHGTPAALHQAIELYAGDLLAGWEDEWIATERERLRQLQIAALRRLVAHHRALGAYEAALALARRALVHDPLAEAAHRDLIALFYEAGDRGAALAAYDQLSALLESELGVAPMTETQTLRAAIAKGAPLPPVIDPAGVVAAHAFGQPELPSLVGRESELKALHSHWESAATGHGRIVTVSGAAGVGKSHLVRAFAGSVATSGGLPLTGHCYEFEQALPYQAIAEMLREAGALLRHAGLAAAHRPVLARLAPDVLGASGAPGASSDALTADPRAQLFEALWQAFLALARSQPLLLVIEDMHWAAESTIDWLTYVAPRLDGASILVTITYRTEELDAGRPLARLSRRLVRAASIQPLTVDPLSPAAHRELVRRLSGLPYDVIGPLASRLFEETAGNPFFLHEIVRELIETGQLTVRDGHWEGAFVDDAPTASLPLPDSVRELISARMERIEAESRTFIQVAAVSGRVFQYDAVQRAIGWMDEPALQALDDVIARGFARQHDGQGDFAFAHHLVQEAIYAGMTTPRRVFWHRRLARAIEALRPDDAESLAHHFNRAGDDDRARVYYAQAGDRARRLAALDDAARYYRAALDRWPESGHPDRAELLYKLGQCQWVLGELHAALRSLEESSAAFQTLGSPLQVGDIERTIGRVYWELNDRQASLKHYHRALAILDQEPESVELARAISSISQMHMLAAELDEAIAWGERALALAERLGAEDVAIHAQTNFGLSLTSPRDSERGLAMLRDSLRRALDANLPHDAMRIYFGLAEQLLSLGRYAEALETYDALLSYARRVHSDFFTGIALRSLVQLEWFTGQWAEALTHRRQLLDWMRVGSRSHLGAVWAGRVLGMLHNDLGQADLARRALERDLATARGAAELQTTVPHLAELARAYAALEREADAAEVVEELLAWVDRSPQMVFDCIMPLVAACRWLAARIDAPDLDTLRACVARLRRADEQLGTTESQAALAEGTGIVQLAEGDPAQAARQLDPAAAGWESLVRPYDRALALCALGVALHRTGQVDAARGAFDRAIAVRDALAAQLADPELKTSFLNSPAMRELRAARSRLDALD